jgi:glycosyltransferase involved in cell wall biosynthesis
VDSPPTDPNGDFRIMHHGSIVHRHGVDLLVEAIARIRPQIPNIRLDIYGSHTPFLEDVLAIADRYGLAEVVRFHGPKTQDQIAEAIRQCNVGVVPNRKSPFTEINFPTRLFEYLAMNRPVIAPATKGIADYFGADELLTFEPGNIEDLGNKLVWVHLHPALAADITERGRHIYTRNLWTTEKERFLAQVDALLSKRRPNHHSDSSPKRLVNSLPVPSTSGNLTPESSHDL